MVWCNHKRGAIIRCSTPAEHRRASLLISMPGSCSSGGMICPMYFPSKVTSTAASAEVRLSEGIRGSSNRLVSASHLSDQLFGIRVVMRHHRRGHRAMVRHATEGKKEGSRACVLLSCLGGMEDASTKEFEA